MQEDQIKQHRQKQMEKFYADVYQSFATLIGNFKTELSKDKSGLRIHQNPHGIIPDPPKTGLRIFRQGGVRQVAKEVVDSALSQVREEVGNLKSQAKETVLDKVEVVARNFVKDQERQRQGGQSIEQAFAEMIAPESPKASAEATPKREDPDKQAFAEIIAPAPELPKVPAEAATQKEEPDPLPVAENVKVKDRLLYADNSIQPEMQMADMLAVAELFTARKGDRLSGDEAKNLTVEFNGHLLLKTDKEGQVETNNLQNQEILSNFTFREKNQIADSIAQFEALKPQLEQAIQMQKPANIPSLIEGVKEKILDTENRIRNSEAQIPSQSAMSPLAKEIHQEIGSERTGTHGGEPATPVLETLPTPAKLPSQQLEQLPSPTHLRLANMATVVFHANYSGEIPAQGKVQAPTGTVIEKVIVDEKVKAFELSVNHEGQKYHLASYNAGTWTIREGMAQAEPLLQKIAEQIDAEGSFKEPEVKPRREIVQEVPNRQPTEPERDYER